MVDRDRREGSLLRKTGLGLASCALGLVVAELGLRALDLPSKSFGFLNAERADEVVFEPDERRFWRLRSDAPELRVNRHGLRGFWPERAKRAGELRIACIGDSCSFGTNVRYEETYGMWLERELTERRPDLEPTTVLAALPGYSTYQSVVLFDEVVRDFDPDWTLIYCGAWNDYVAAMGASDSERVEAGGRLHVRALLDEALTEAPSREAYLAGMRTGETIDGERVPMDEFKANLRELVRGAKETGQALLIVPPVPASTSADYPAGALYRAAIREVATETTAFLIDGGSLFDEALQEVPSEWRLDPRTRESLYFSDWIHPSAAGHALLGKAVLKVIEDSLPPLANSGRDRIQLVGARIEAGPMTETMELNLDRPLAQFDRVWIGRTWIENIELQQGSNLTLRNLTGLVPGIHDLWLHTKEGVLRGPEAVRVEPDALEVQLVRDGEHFLLRAKVSGSPGMIASLWLSPSLREQPEPTRFGDFRLSEEPDGRPTGRRDLPFRFDRIPFRFSGTVDDGGVWELGKRLEVDLVGLEVLYAQGGVHRAGPNEFGALTTVVELDVPK